MNRIKLVLWIYVALFTMGLITATAFAQIVPKYAKLPKTDGIDDVYYNTTGNQIEFDGSGNYTDWIDIVKVNITGSDIIVEFQAPSGRSGSNYIFGIAWDINGDKTADIIISYMSAYGYVMQNQISEHPQYGYVWKGSYWSVMIGAMPSTDSGVYLTLQTVSDAMDAINYTLENLNFRMYTYWSDLSTFAYADFLPEVFGGGIPGFQIYSIIFSLTTLISLISIYKYKR